MSRRRWLVAVLAVGLAVGSVPANAQSTVDDLAQFVNPYVGTRPGGPDQGTGGGAGNTFPGADVPFGMVQWSPDTVTPQHGGYFYDDNRLRGFSLTHLSGAGCSTYEDIPFMPFVGEVTTSPATDPGRYVAKFKHANENVTPGYYGVSLDSGAKVDLSVTQRTGMGRFQFPAGAPATLLVNTSGSVAGTDDAQVTIGTDTISGWATSGRFCGATNSYRVYFSARFDRPFESVGTWKNGAVTPGRASERGGSQPKVDLRKSAKALDTTVSGPGSGGFVTFDSFDNDTVNVRVGLSFVSMDGAAANLAAESGDKTFDQVKDAARAAWNSRLNAIRVTGGTTDRKTTFYTALYHSLLQPNVFSDVDGRYTGFDGRVHTADKGHAMYTNFSGWDIYRSEAQLLALIAPNEMSDIARSMIAYAEQGGSWDRWTVANGYSGVMVGDPYHVIVSTAYAFGAKDFDAGKALLLMLRGATQPTQGYVERPGLADYQNLGYVPMGAAGVWGPAATTLEYASADFAISQLARRLGDSATWSTFAKRAQNWQNLYNPANNYLQPRTKDGAFTQSFNPGSGDGYVEGNGAQYSWMVPYDPRGLFNAMGGDATVVNRLDTFFTQLNAGPNQPYAFMGNEPNANVPWLYDYAGAPAKTQATVRRIMDELYSPHEDGLVGNDDLGQMSAWYVWAAIGAYPMIPGRAELVLNGPSFSQVVVTRPTGATITINASGAGQYVGGLTFNGRPSTRTWLPESVVDKGGTVDFAMSTTPATWGTGAGDAPPSFRDGEVGQRGYVNPARILLPAGTSGFVEIGAQDFSGDGAQVQWTAPPPPGIAVIPGGGSIDVPPGGRAGRSIALRAEPDTPEATYQVAVTFSGPGGSLGSATLQILVAPPGSLRASFNNIGISPDNAMSVANFDNVGFSYSANALANVGVKPGAAITVDGLAHTWPITGLGEPDNVVAAGQTIVVTAPAGATKLALLGSAANGSASGTLTVTYTDGTTQQAAVGFSDWTLGGGGQTPSFGNRIAAASQYRNSVNGNTQGITTYVFATAPIGLDATKQIRSVTLPGSVSGGSLHVFALTAG
ncbi:GH92 family glycosyl hydrolase [Actinocrispum wychmicini]|uniref:Putative alpha-1,2-mannosidase n=1 Tax=Actinocrispum wychmicini TaxID=1213861 RepID=A0A4R2JSZ7_9PSEU|nr:GH92 family glycosyl hydrolase [Actinocrispum wychmicini]TCO57295.1 putative alpha-1,2-mannosidase [Actinocrispum wychmicini]